MSAGFGCRVRYTTGMEPKATDFPCDSVGMAKLLGVTDRRVRALAAKHEIGQRLAGHRLIFQADDYRAFMQRKPDYRLLNTGIASGVKEPKPSKKRRKKLVKVGASTRKSRVV